MFEGNCSSIYNKEFPEWLKEMYFDFQKLELPYNLWNALYNEFAEDLRVLDGRDKSDAQKIMEQISTTLSKHRELNIQKALKTF